MSKIDWPGLMRAGLHGLQLLPREFWALTPAELALMLGQARGAASMSRRQLEDLLTAYPDEVKGETDE